MKKIALWSVAVLVVMVGLSSEGMEAANPSPDDQILNGAGVPSWVPNPFTGSHEWKKFFSDEKYSPSKKPESIWHFDSKSTKKVSSEKLNFRGQAMGLEGATLAWVKVVEVKTNRAKYLYYALWPEKRVALFFGIFEREDGTRYFEDVSEKEEIQTLAPGMMREILESLHSAVFKPWWKVW